MTVARASHRLDQPNALIIAQSMRGHPAALCHASDRIAGVSHTSNVHLRAHSKSRAMREEQKHAFCNQKQSERGPPCRMAYPSHVREVMAGDVGYERMLASALEEARAGRIEGGIPIG